MLQTVRGEWIPSARHIHHDALVKRNTVVIIGRISAGAFVIPSIHARAHALPVAGKILRQESNLSAEISTHACGNLSYSKSLRSCSARYMPAAGKFLGQRRPTACEANDGICSQDWPGKRRRRRKDPAGHGYAVAEVVKIDDGQRMRYDADPYVGIKVLSPVAPRGKAKVKQDCVLNASPPVSFSRAIYVPCNASLSCAPSVPNTDPIPAVLSSQLYARRLSAASRMG